MERNTCLRKKPRQKPRLSQKKKKRRNFPRKKMLKWRKRKTMKKMKKKMMKKKRKKAGVTTKMATAGAKATAKRSPPHPM